MYVFSSFAFQQNRLRILTAEHAQISSKQLGIHLALSALSSLQAKHVQSQSQSEFTPTLEDLTAAAQVLLPEGVDLQDEDLNNAVGELCVALY